MDPIERLFGKYLEEFIPNLPNRAGIVRDLILYNSAKDSSKSKKVRRCTGDQMEIDLGDFEIHVFLDRPR